MTGRPSDTLLPPGWQWATAAVRNIDNVTLGSLGHDFALGQDWTGTETLDFWFYGTGGGEDVTVTLKDNRAPDPGPSGWEMAWSDEFDESAGTPPNPANWTYEIGDGDAGRHERLGQLRAPVLHRRSRQRADRR